jgi:hypothetical protein
MIREVSTVNLVSLFADDGPSEIILTSITP